MIPIVGCMCVHSPTIANPNSVLGKFNDYISQLEGVKKIKLEDYNNRYTWLFPPIMLREAQKNDPESVPKLMVLLINDLYIKLRSLYNERLI